MVNSIGGVLQVPPELVEALVAAAKKPAFAAAEAEVANVFAEGYGVNAVIEQLLESVMCCETMPEAAKAKAVAAMAVADKRLVDGADGVLQLQHVMSVLQQAFHAK